MSLSIVLILVGHGAPVMMDPNIKAQHSYGEVEVSQLSDLPLM